MMKRLRPLLRDVSAISAKALGLPRNYSTREIKRRMESVDDAAVPELRISAFGKAFGASAGTINEIVAAFHREGWSEIWGRYPAGLPIGSPMVGEEQITLYTLVRLANPSVCVETGAASGGSSTVILGHLNAAQQGRLYSVDVTPPKGYEYGWLIPEGLRERWELRIQSAKPILPELLAELQQIDFFLHDSLHRVGHMRWEYELAWERLRSGGCLASHDVLYTTAFDDFIRTHPKEIAAGASIGNFGFLRKA